TSDLMISDWSGAALEFALGLERPVIFVDVPRKVLNAEYQDLGIEPLEVTIRHEVGVVVSPTDLETLGSVALELIDQSPRWAEAARDARRRWVFNNGTSGSAGARYLMSLIQ